VALAEALRARTDGVLGHAFYGSDGASAIEIALKMSFHSWRNQGHAQKREFVCLKHSYHGETLGALSVTDVAIFRDAYDPLLMRAHVVASPDARQAESGQTAIDVANHALQSLRTVFDQRAEKIAAVLIEPLVQCAAGMAMHDPHYLRGVRALCDEFDVHLIADEIAVGCGRTGTFFAFEQAQIGNINTWPDFLTLSKGITGGYLPLSIVLTRDEIYRSFWDDQTARGFLHSHSYTGNPLACRAAQTVLAKFSQNDVLNQNMQRTAPLRTLWHELTNDPRIQHARCQGMIFAFDVASKFVGDNFSERFHQTGLKNELLIRPIGNTVYVMPSYLLAPQDYDWLGQQVVKTLDGVVS
jgi:adenosylmethionine-8-amino-7-oxononanoate aminotransferase